MDTNTIGYNDKLDPDQQITMEEAIAARVFEAGEIGEDAAADLGRDILLMVLAEFRPDLIEQEGTTND